jgi:chorismate mutase/prephenate dehydratase
MDLQAYREDIDRIDEKIVRLFEERMEISGKVAEYKIGVGKKVYDKQREEEKVKSLVEKAHTDFNRHGVEELFKQVMSISRKLQYQVLEESGMISPAVFEQIPKNSIDHEKARVVFQGVEGAYSEQAMKEYFGENVNCFHVKTFRDAMEAVKRKEADFAVLPIENSSAGIVNDVYDLLVEYDNYIVGEQDIKVEHALLGIEGAKLSDIKTVYSHPQALMQCSRYLEEHREWKQISLQNTAASAKKVVEENDRSKAAIASRRAAECYGLKVLKEQINYSNINTTRFIIVTNKKVFLEGAEKISLYFEVPHESGSLYNILSHIIFNNLNMTKIESRPMVERNWEYRFFVDFEGNLLEPGVRNALRGIREEAKNLKILGNYYPSK